MNEEMQHGRGPSFDGWPDVTAKLKKASGWKLRNTLDISLEHIQTDIGASMSHYEKQEWANMLVCIEDAHEGITKLMQRLKGKPSAGALGEREAGK